MGIVFSGGTQSDPAMFETGTVTMSGQTSRTISGFPANTTKIIVNFWDVGYSGGNSLLRLQIGDSGGIETSGYWGVYLYAGNGSNGSGTRTDGFAFWSINSGEHTDGHVELTNIQGTNQWLMSYKGVFEPFYTCTSGGIKTLSGSLTQIKVYVEGGNSFDQGQINAIYETLG